MSALLAGLGAGLTATGKAYEGILDDRREDKQLQDQRDWERKKMKIAEKYRVDALKEQREYDAGLLRKEREYEARKTAAKMAYDAGQAEEERKARLAEAKARAGDSGKLTPEAKVYQDRVNNLDKTIASYNKKTAELDPEFNAAEIERLQNAVVELGKERTFYIESLAKSVGGTAYKKPTMVDIIVDGKPHQVTEAEAERLRKIKARKQVAHPRSEPQVRDLRGVFDEPAQDIEPAPAPIYSVPKTPSRGSGSIPGGVPTFGAREREGRAQQTFKALYDRALEAKKTGDTKALTALETAMEKVLQEQASHMDFNDLGLFGSDSGWAIHQFKRLFGRAPALK